MADKESEGKEGSGKLKNELKEAQDRLQARVNEAPQFKELMKMVQEKNAQIRDLRTALKNAGVPLPGPAGAPAKAVA